VTNEEEVKWEPTGSDTYTGNKDRGTVDASLAMIQVMHYAQSLACIFLFMVPLAFFEQVATWTKTFTEIGLWRSLLPILMSNRKQGGILQRFLQR